MQHFEQVTHNVSRTCRFFGISRGQFYTWLRRYREHGLEGLKNLKSGSRKPHLSTPPHIVAELVPRAGVIALLVNPNEAAVKVRKHPVATKPTIF